MSHSISENDNVLRMFLERTNAEDIADPGEIPSQLSSHLFISTVIASEMEWKWSKFPILISVLSARNVLRCRRSHRCPFVPKNGSSLPRDPRACCQSEEGHHAKKHSELFVMSDRGPTSVEDLYDQLIQEPFLYVTEGVFILVISLFGILGNCCSIWTFSRQRIHRTFHNLLLALSIFDLIYVVCSLHLFSFARFWPEYDQHIRVRSLPVIIPIAQIGLMGSVYCTLAMALERFLAVCHPFLHRRRVYSSRTFLVPVVLFTVVYNIPKFFELKVEYVRFNLANLTAGLVANGSFSYDEETGVLTSLTDEDYHLNLTSLYEDYDYKMNYTDYYGGNMTMVWQLYPTDLRLNRMYIRVYILWMNLILQIVGPFIVLVTLNFLVYKRIKKFEETLRGQLRVCFSTGTSARGRNHPRAQSGRSGHDRIETIERCRASRTGSEDAGSEDDRRHSNASRHMVDKLRAPLGRSGSFSTPRKREVMLSKVSIYIVFMYLFCHGIRLIPNTYEMVHTYSQDYEKKDMPWPDWVAKITNISHVLLTLACSSNFFIYYLKHGSLCRTTSRNPGETMTLATRNCNSQMPNNDQEMVALFDNKRKSPAEAASPSPRMLHHSAKERNSTKRMEF